MELQQLQALPLTELARRLCHLFNRGYGRSQDLPSPPKNRRKPK